MKDISKTEMVAHVLALAIALAVVAVAIVGGPRMNGAL